MRGLHSPKMVLSTLKTFYEGFGTHLVRAEKIRSPLAPKGRFGTVEISAKPISTIFSSKKFLWPIFWVGRGSSLGRPNASWVASFGQNCIIMRSKVPGSLSIKFRDDFPKFEEMPNSCHFSKLTVDSTPNKLNTYERRLCAEKQPSDLKNLWRSATKSH